jgi:ActR/RegA family two-component response regulator
MGEERVRRLLLVDDDDAFREVMGLELTERGFQVLSAPDHRTALTLAMAHRPSCAVVDLRLENERGLEVVRDLVERLPGIRVGV